MQVNLDNAEKLQQLLNELTELKLTALDEFTHEELRADQASQIFLLQCANLSRKIQGKLPLYMFKDNQF